MEVQLKSNDQTILKATIISIIIRRIIFIPNFLSFLFTQRLRSDIS